MLENTGMVFQNGQSRDTGAIGYRIHRTKTNNKNTNRQHNTVIMVTLFSKLFRTDLYLSRKRLIGTGYNEV